MPRTALRLSHLEGHRRGGTPRSQRRRQNGLTVRGLDLLTEAIVIYGQSCVVGRIRRAASVSLGYGWIAEIYRIKRWREDAYIGFGAGNDKAVDAAAAISSLGNARPRRSGVDAFMNYRTGGHRRQCWDQLDQLNSARSMSDSAVS